MVLLAPTVTALQTLLEVCHSYAGQHDIVFITDHIKVVDLVDLDFQKAFAKVPHERLMLKVNAHGIQGDADR